MNMKSFLYIYFDLIEKYFILIILFMPGCGSKGVFKTGIF